MTVSATDWAMNGCQHQGTLAYYVERQPYKY